MCCVSPSSDFTASLTWIVVCMPTCGDLSLQEGVGSNACALLLDTMPMPDQTEYTVVLNEKKSIFYILYILISQACGDIEDHFRSKTRVVIFEDDESILQVFVVGENDSLMELPATTTIGQGLVYLMATYYVFNVDYPKPYQPLLYF